MHQLVLSNCLHQVNTSTQNPLLPPILSTSSLQSLESLISQYVDLTASSSSSYLDPTSPDTEMVSDACELNDDSLLFTSSGYASSSNEYFSVPSPPPLPSPLQNQEKNSQSQPTLPPPPFDTPPKLVPIEHLMKEYRAQMNCNSVHWR